MMWPFRNRATTPVDPDPDFINGFRVRRRHKACPLCKADPKSWCSADCTAIDLMDYR